MKKYTIILLAILLAPCSVFSTENNEELSRKIIAMEKAALEKWNNGDPSGYLEIYAGDITYFDPFSQLRIDGYDKMKEMYDSIKGQISVVKYEMINPKVQFTKDMAVLTFNLVSYTKESVIKWNCTEIYKKETGGQWKIIHNHWSFIRPMDMKVPE